jgi:hypothetical protein
MNTEHPRFHHYPHHQDYINLRMVVRPFVQLIHEPMYRTPSVNTDKLGLREQYDAGGAFIDLEQMKSKYKKCNVLIGGSTAFGVDATTDRHTLGSLLANADIPCVNLGVRGATSQQELLNFQVFKRLLPAVANVIMFSGINNCSLASLDGTLRYPHFGSMFAEELVKQHLWGDWQEISDRNIEREYTARYRFSTSIKRKIDYWYANSRVFRGGLKLYYGRLKRPDVNQFVDTPMLSFSDRARIVLEHLENDLETWSALSQQLDFRLHYVLQPAISWCAKELTPIELACFNEDCKRFPSMSRYANRNFYLQYSAQISAFCKRFKLHYHDVNTWIDKSYSKEDVFTDVCHLTDNGTRLISATLRERLDWKCN